MSILTKDIWICISDYLCYVDKMSLKLVCKKSSKIKLNFKKVILGKLSKYIDDPKEFCKKLFECKAIISGSFILACLYDTDNFGDIDIFDETNVQNNITRFSHYLYLERKYSYDFYLYELVYNIRNFNVSGTKLQHIALYMNPIKFINMTFDMEICKNYYDGKNLYVKSWTKLIQRKDYIKPNGLLMSFYTNDYEVDELSEKRRIKYIKKGFDVTLHPNYGKIKNINQERFRKIY